MCYSQKLKFKSILKAYLLLSINVLKAVGACQQESFTLLNSIYVNESLIYLNPQTKFAHRPCHLSWHPQLYMQIQTLYPFCCFLSVSLAKFCMFFSTFSCQNRNQLKPNKRLGRQMRAHSLFEVFKAGDQPATRNERQAAQINQQIAPNYYVNYNFLLTALPCQKVKVLNNVEIMFQRLTKRKP